MLTSSISKNECLYRPRHQLAIKGPQWYSLPFLKKNLHQKDQKNLRDFVIKEKKAASSVNPRIAVRSVILNMNSLTLLIKVVIRIDTVGQ